MISQPSSKMSLERIAYSWTQPLFPSVKNGTQAEIDSARKLLLRLLEWTPLLFEVLHIIYRKLICAESGKHSRATWKRFAYKQNKQSGISASLGNKTQRRENTKCWPSCNCPHKLTSDPFFAKIALYRISCRRRRN